MAALFQLILCPWHSRGRKHSYFGPRPAVNTSLVPKNNLKMKIARIFCGQEPWSISRETPNQSMLRFHHCFIKKLIFKVFALAPKQRHKTLWIAEKYVGNQWDKDGYNNKLEDGKLPWKWSRFWLWTPCLQWCCNLKLQSVISVWCSSRHHCVTRMTHEFI